jgi:ABC-type bacteriocin/lantibiotic exporter with double-glycine peptidase domain
MLSYIHPVFTDLLRILHLLSRHLRVRAAAVFTLMFAQSLLELGFILALTHMGLALADGDTLRANLLYRAIFHLIPPLKLWTADPRQLLLLAGIVLITVCGIKNVMNYVTARSIALLGEDISLFIGADVMERFLYRDYAWHLSSESDAMFQRMLWRGNLGFMLTHLLTLYASILTLTVLFLSLVGQEPVLTTLVVILTGSVGCILYRGIRRHVDGNATRAANSAQEETRALMCATKGIREVLIYRQQPAFLRALLQATLKGREPRTFMNIAPTLPTWVLEGTGFAVVIITIVYLVYVQDASAKRITAALALLLLTAWRVLPYCNRLVSLQISIRSLRPMTDAVLELLERLRAAPAAVSSAPAEDFSFVREITLCNVCFRYSQATDDSLHDISITLRKGEKVGLIGPSGSGKSTLAGVLSGLLPPTAGHMTVDGDELTPPRAAAFAMQIGYVPQTPFLFAGTLAENIAFSQWGHPWEEARVREACTQAAIDFVDMHPAGLDQPIGENGAGLSGGQAQRVSIARAMYTRPAILIFDEATSALDQANENTIQRTIERLADSVTCVIIAHRLTTVECCDTLIWLDNGRVVMQGAPQKVLDAYRQSQNGFSV